MDPAKGPVLVTGSSGLIGSALIRGMGGRYSAIGFDREGPPYPPASADCVFVDLTSDESVQNAFTQVRVAHGRKLASVVHLAAHYDFSGAPSPLYDAVTIGGTRRLLRELRDFEVGQIVFSSTMLVHAPSSPGRKIREDSPLAPAWPYPASKVKTEAVLREERGSIPLLILRIAGVYDDVGHSLPLSRQIRRIYERRLTGRVFPGNPGNGQSYVHLDDVVDAILRAIDRRGDLAREETLLIGEPEAPSYAELQSEIGRLIHGRAWPAKPIPRSLAKAGAWIRNRFGDSFIKPWMIDLADQSFEIDPGRAREVLGWSPRRNLRDTLPGMIASLRKDPRRWYREHGLALPRALDRKIG